MPSEPQVSERSENVIATLLPEVQPLARDLIGKAAEAGIKIEILSGLRSYAEQDKLFAKGRTAPGPKVTNAQGGHSNHNFGIAFDIGVFEGSRYIEESPAYAKVGTMGKELGLFWGGDWESIQDEPHFELRPDWAADLKESDMLAQLRDRHDSGQGVFA
jgi:peptidoglycan L-alanyl-D-glutamate endopeptidase CwlK